MWMVTVVQLFEMETSENSKVEFVIYVEREGEVYSEERRKPKKANVTALHNIF